MTWTGDSCLVLVALSDPKEEKRTQLVWVIRQGKSPPGVPQLVSPVLLSLLLKSTQCHKRLGIQPHICHLKPSGILIDCQKSPWNTPSGEKVQWRLLTTTGSLCHQLYHQDSAFGNSQLSCPFGSASYWCCLVHLSGFKTMLFSVYRLYLPVNLYPPLNGWTQSQSLIHLDSFSTSF